MIESSVDTSKSAVNTHPAESPGTATPTAQAATAQAETAQAPTAQATTAAQPATAPARVSRPLRKKKRGKKLIITIAVLAAGALGVSQLMGGSSTAIAAETVKVKRQDLQVVSSANGTVTAAQTVPLSFRTAGTITEMNVVIGQQVKAGATLAAVDSKVAKREIETQQAAVAEAQARVVAASTGAASSPKDRAAGAAAVEQSRAQTEANRRAEAEAARVSAQSATLNSQTVAQAEAQASTDALQLKVEEQRLTEQTDKRTAVLAKRDVAQANLDAAKAKVTTAQTNRNAARDDLTTQRQRNATLLATRDDAQRAYQKVVADDDRLRQAAQAAADPLIPFAWAKSTLITNAEAALATAEKALAAGEASLIPMQLAVEKTQELVGTAETEQATAQGRLDSAVEKIEAAQAAVDAANRTREQASITAQRSQDAVAVAKRNAELTTARDRQAVEASKQATKQSEVATNATARANAAKEQGGRPVDVATARAAVRSAELSLAQAKDRINDYRIVAPFDGVVTALAVKTGEQAVTATPAITIMTTTGFLVRVGFPEVDAARIEPGDTAVVAYDALPEQPAKGTVESVEPTATTVNGVSTYYARVLLDSTPATIRVGMTANVKVLTETRKDALALPLAAISQNENGESIVRKVTEDAKKDDKSKKTRKVTIAVVELGVTNDGSVEILKGVSEGDTVELTSTAKK